MTTQRSTRSVSRRSTLAALAGGGLGLAAGSRAGAASQDTGSLADHPQVGAWLVLNAPTGPTTIIFAADGTAVFGTQATQAGPQGGVFVSAQLGVWDSTDERSIRFTGVQLPSDADGASAGSVTIDAYQTVSEDGQSFASDPESVVTIRDPAYNVVMVIGPNADGPPVTGVRMNIGAPGFPEATPDTGATPAG